VKEPASGSWTELKRRARGKAEVDARSSMTLLRFFVSTASLSPPADAICASLTKP